MTDDQSTPVVDNEGTGPAPGPPDLCLLHLNYQPCPWCEAPAEGDGSPTPPKRGPGRPRKA